MHGPGGCTQMAVYEESGGRVQPFCGGVGLRRFCGRGKCHFANHVMLCRFFFLWKRLLIGVRAERQKKRYKSEKT